jgi:hypothetical protein
LKVIEYLNDARDHSWEGLWPEAPERSLRQLAGLLAAEGSETMAIYLRRDTHTSRRRTLFVNLKVEDAQYTKWEAHEIEASEDAAREQYEQATPEERAKMDASVAEFFARSLGSVPDDRERTDEGDS